jgi:hypothetical protein
MLRRTAKHRPPNSHLINQSRSKERGKSDHNAMWYEFDPALGRLLSGVPRSPFITSNGCGRLPRSLRLDCDVPTSCANDHNGRDGHDVVDLLRRGRRAVADTRAVRWAYTVINTSNNRTMRSSWKLGAGNLTPYQCSQLCRRFASAARQTAPSSAPAAKPPTCAQNATPPSAARAPSDPTPLKSCIRNQIPRK